MDSAQKPRRGSSPFKIGTRLGRYQLLAPLAAGGMAHVWAAKPQGKFGFSRTVALKVIRPEYSADTEYTRMLIDEATVAGAVHHPNVCELYEFDEADGVLFMVMEWVAGDSLAGLLHQQSRLKPIRYQYAARIVAEACAGVHAAHEATDGEGRPLNIVHRDISPPNVLISREGQVKVSDFGIAKARYQLHERTRTGDIKGKFAYIPPEQILGKGVSRRSDVYALGCALYVATLGLRPFGRGPGAMPKIMRGEYRRPVELLRSYPADLDAIIVKALSSDPQNRFGTAEELRLALEEWLVRSGHVVTPSDIARVVRRRISAERRQTIDALRHTNQSLLCALAERAEREKPQDDLTQTPTASSGVVLQPDEDSRSSPTSTDKRTTGRMGSLTRNDDGREARGAPTSSPPVSAPVNSQGAASGREEETLDAPPELQSWSLEPEPPTGSPPPAPANHDALGKQAGPADAPLPRATPRAAPAQASSTPAGSTVATLIIAAVTLAVAAWWALGQ